MGAFGQTHTADPYWLNTTQCNGVIVQYQSTIYPSGWCYISDNPTITGSAQNNVRRLADVLGQVEAGAPAGTKAHPTNASTTTTRRNHAITAWTAAVDGPDNAVEYQSSPISISAPGGRFYAASVDVAETSCEFKDGVNNSRLHFDVVADGTTLPLSDSPIRACTDPKVGYYTSPDLPGGWSSGGAYVAAGRFTSDHPQLFSGDELQAVQLVMRNETGAFDGNDAAFDNVRFIDVTPQLDKSFSPKRVRAGAVSTLTFTVTNTSELAAKSGWSFIDALPQGLVVADPADVGGTCDASVVAAAGASDITVSGTLAAGQVFCTITVGVTSATAGSYTNGPDNVTENGLYKPGGADVEFIDPSYTVAKSADVSSAQPGELVTYTITVTNTGDWAYDDSGLAGLKRATFTDDLSGALDDASYIDDLASPGLSLDGSTLSWSGTLDVGQTRHISYAVRVDDPVTGDGVLFNHVVAPPDIGGSCDDTVGCDTTTPIDSSWTVLIQKNGYSADGQVIGLDGSSFRLLADDAGKPGAPLTQIPVEATDAGAGRFEADGLAPGTYWLEETAAPRGYSLLAQPVAFRVGTDGSIALVDPAAAPVTVVEGVLTVRDQPALVLPAAGGSGTGALVATGTATSLAAALGALLLRRRRHPTPQ